MSGILPAICRRALADAVDTTKGKALEPAGFCGFAGF